MTEQYKDSYQNKYREEITQIHAPQSLIERTKAAMREEEMRLAQVSVSGKGTAAEALEMTYANGSRQSRKFSVRSLAYPLTAAAALLILASVSLTMRGLKGTNMAPAADTAYSGAAENAAVYEESAADAGYEETAIEMPAAETTFEMAEEEGAAMEPAAGAAETESAAAEAPAGDRGPDVNVHKAMSAAEDMTQSATSNAEESEAMREEAEQEKKEAIEDSLADLAVDKDSIIMEKVEKKPAFCDLPDTKTCVYEDKTFLVREEKAGWVAYVETENGEGYLFRGEMEDMEEFLKAVNQSLAERNTVQNP